MDPQNKKRNGQLALHTKFAIAQIQVCNCTDSFFLNKVLRYDNMIINKALCFQCFYAFSLFYHERGMGQTSLYK